MAIRYATPFWKKKKERKVKFDEPKQDINRNRKWQIYPGLAEAPGNFTWSSYKDIILASVEQLYHL